MEKIRSISLETFLPMSLNPLTNDTFNRTSLVQGHQVPLNTTEVQINQPSNDSTVAEKINQSNVPSISSSTDVNTCMVTKATSQSTLGAFLQKVKDFFQALCNFLFGSSNAKSFAESTQTFRNAIQQASSEQKDHTGELFHALLDSTQQAIRDKRKEADNVDKPSLEKADQNIRNIKKIFHFPSSSNDIETISTKDLPKLEEIDALEKDLQDMLDAHQTLEALEQKILQQCTKHHYRPSEIDLKTCDRWKTQLGSHQLATENPIWNDLQKRNEDCRRVTCFSLPLFEKAYQADGLSLAALRELQTELTKSKTDVLCQLTGGILSKGIEQGYEDALKKVNEQIFQVIRSHPIDIEKKSDTPIENPSPNTISRNRFHQENRSRRITGHAPMKHRPNRSENLEKAPPSPSSSVRQSAHTEVHHSTSTLSSGPRTNRFAQEPQSNRRR